MCVFVCNNNIACYKLNQRGDGRGKKVRSTLTTLTLSHPPNDPRVLCLLGYLKTVYLFPWRLVLLVSYGELVSFT